MNLSKLMMGLLMMCCITACGGRTVTQNKTILVAPSDALLLDCPISPPPTKITKQSLVNAYSQQTLNIKKCNQDKALLREWKSNQIKRLGETNGSRIK